MAQRSRNSFLFSADWRSRLCDGLSRGVVSSDGHGRGTSRAPAAGHVRQGGVAIHRVIVCIVGPPPSIASDKMPPCSLRATSPPRHARRARLRRKLRRLRATARGSGGSVALRCARRPRIRMGDGGRVPPAGAPRSRCQGHAAAPFRFRLVRRGVGFAVVFRRGRDFAGGASSSGSTPRSFSNEPMVR